MTAYTDQKLASFIKTTPTGHFPIQNLPYGVFSSSSNALKRVGVAIGSQVLDLSVLEENGLFKGATPLNANLFSAGSLNRFMACGPEVWRTVRETITQLLRADNPSLRDNSPIREKSFFPFSEVELHMPVVIGDYTDFYASKYHAENVGTMFRGAENALMPNYLHLPVGYHGRSSSVVVSGTDIHRPYGQTDPSGEGEPTFGASRLMDFELEMGSIIGYGNKLGSPIEINNAGDHIFGMVLVNDWSARDIQKWEYQPLGPFLAKNFATSISPWVVPMDALEPFRVEGQKMEPEPLTYLRSKQNWAFDVSLEVSLQSEQMDSPAVITRSNLRHLYWSIAQQLAHHTITGCNMNTGDMLATGTISGPDKGSRGCMLELSWKGTEPLSFPNGETRKFLQDGDRVTMTGWCQGDGYRVGFGEVTGKLLPAT